MLAPHSSSTGTYASSRPRTSLTSSPTDIYSPRSAPGCAILACCQKGCSESAWKCDFWFVWRSTPAPRSMQTLRLTIIRPRTSFTASISDRHSQRTTPRLMRFPTEHRSVPALFLACFSTDFSDFKCQAAVNVLHNAEIASVHRRYADAERE